MGRRIRPSVPDTIKKKKRRKWEEEIAIVTLLTFLIMPESGLGSGGK